MVRHRVDQELERQRRAASVARHECDGRRQVAPGTVAADGDPPGIHPELVGVPRDITGRRVTVIERAPGSGARRAGGSRPRSTTHPEALASRRQGASIVSGAAEHPAAAVEVDQGGLRPRSRRRINPHPRTAGQRAVLNLVDRLRAARPARTCATNRFRASSTGSVSKPAAPESFIFFEESPRLRVQPAVVGLGWRPFAGASPAA